MSPHVVVSASDDHTCQLWDRRCKSKIGILQHDDNCTADPSVPVTAVAASQGSSQIFTAGLDNAIYCWDWRAISDGEGQEGKKVYKLKGHSDTVTCLSVHPDGTHLLSNSMDQTLKSWDIAPFVTGKSRLVQTFTGHMHSADKGLLKCAWSGGSGEMVAAGGSGRDHMVHIWDVLTGEELYLLPGHSGSVNAVAFHPKETTVIASGSSDKTIYVGELS